MAIEWTPGVLAALAAALLLGGVLGTLLGRRIGNQDRERAEQLAAELTETREELETSREEIGRHFQTTSDLFRDLTQQYTRLYAHLAEGARQFSTGEAPALARGFDGPLLGSNGGEEAEARRGDAGEGEPGASERREARNGGSAPTTA